MIILGGLHGGLYVNAQIRMVDKENASNMGFSVADSMITRAGEVSK